MFLGQRVYVLGPLHVSIAARGFSLESLRVVTVLAGDVTHGGENSMTRASEEFRSIATEASAGAGDQNYLCS
jgi:hypothetical protein